MPNVCLLPVKDAIIDRQTPTTNYGSGGSAIVDVGYVSGVKAWNRRYLASFQTPTGLTSAEVIKAFPYYYMKAPGTSGAAQSVFRITQAWTEAGVTWNKYDGVNDWPGGINACAVEFSTAVDYTTPALGWWHTLDLTEAVRQAITSHSGLLDMMFFLDDENPLVNVVGLSAWTKDYAPSPEEAVFRPQLVIVRPPFGQPMAV